MAVHQLVHIQAIARGGGDASGGGVGLFQQPQFRQVGHLISDGGGGHIQPGLLGHDLRAHRLGGLDIGLYNGLQYSLFPFCQFHCAAVPFAFVS